MELKDCNPFVRAAQIQHAVLEGEGARMAYDHRLFYILEGEGSLILQDEIHTLSPNVLLYFRPGVGYHFRGKMRVIVLNFDLTRDASHRTQPVCPPPAAAFDPSMCFDTTVLEEPARPLIRPSSEDLREDLLLLVRTFDPTDDLADALVSALLKKLLAELFLSQRHGQDPTEELVERVRRYIRLYAAENPDNQRIGQEFGYHPVYIATLFRERTGMTLHHAILEDRIHLACQLLTRTDRSVEEIAYGTGFSSRSHFCTVFRELTGTTPGAYRRKQ